MPGAETFHASADACDRLVGRYSPRLAAAPIDLAGVAYGMRALDVGCGPGALTGALVASCVWDYAGEMTLLRAFWDAAHEVDPQRAAGADERVIMPWCVEGELGELWRAAGLRDVRCAALQVGAA